MDEDLSRISARLQPSDLRDLLAHRDRLGAVPVQANGHEPDMRDGVIPLGHVVKHWSVYERFFHRSAWSLMSVSQLLLTQVVLPLMDKEGPDGPESPEELTFDGTTCARTGKHVAHAGYFKDASVGNAAKTVVHWTHNRLISALSAIRLSRNRQCCEFVTRSGNQLRGKRTDRPARATATRCHRP